MDLNIAQQCLFQELVTNSCPQRIAAVVAGGTTFPKADHNWTSAPPYYRGTPVLGFPRPRFCYVAGPMRGYPEFNFPVFDRARDQLVDKGYAVISPADIDRASGFNETESEPEFTVDLIKQFVLRDFHAVYFMDADKGDRLALLPGWERSTGAYAEAGLARWLTLPFIDEFGAPLRRRGCDVPQLACSMNQYINQIRRNSEAI